MRNATASKSQREGGACRKVWDWLDANKGATSKDVQAWATSEGLNPNNASIEFYQWRKFNGIAKEAKTKAA